jgi:anthranilate synthase/aminodeoxychorismate synthase-like glutamine amidotransferase
MILLIDNYDSFVYNLARYFGELDCDTHVVRNDAVSVADVAALRPDAVVLSPGPCTPYEAGICIELVRKLDAAVPLLGVCLGHQAIAAALGGRVVRSPPVHGRTSRIFHEGVGLFAGMPIPCRGARYHSLIVDECSLPAELRVTARCDEGLVMAIEHVTRPVFGVQFHPEAVLTEQGHRLLANFVRIAGVDCELTTCPEYQEDLPAADFWALDVAPVRFPLPTAL